MELGTYGRVFFVCMVWLFSLCWCVHVLFPHVCVCARVAPKWVRVIGAEQCLSCDVQHLGNWIRRQGGYLAVEMTHSIASALFYFFPFSQKCTPPFKSGFIDIAMCTYIAADIYGIKRAHYPGSFLQLSP